ncbi:hypothetical protein [Roseivivax halodurans]|nr:hypothetical protein [Roseivivax halodurans]
MTMNKVQRIDAGRPAEGDTTTFAGRRVVLVTGAPRSATTPVGNVLSMAPHSFAAYEPLGPTGLRDVADRFPMTGPTDGPNEQDLSLILARIAAFRGPLKPQTRPGAAATLRSRVIGSRTLQSFRLGRLQPWVRNVIWKDPHAIMLVPDLVERGLPVIVTIRRPQAHAGSYKRLGWTSRAAEIHPRWTARFGRDPVSERWLDRASDPVVSGALIWRMSYLPLLREQVLDRVCIVTAPSLEADEMATYRMAFAHAGLDFTGKIARFLERRAEAAADASADSSVVHDWNRSVASANSYWRELLSGEDLEAIEDLTADLEGQLFPAQGGSAEEGRQ